jgi:hypothetical protein
VSRNILNTGVLKELLKSGSSIVIFVVPEKLSFYKESYAQDNVIIEAFDPESFSNRIDKILRSLAEVLVNTNVIRNRMIKKFHNSGRLGSYLYHRFIIAFLGNSKVVKRIFRYIDRNLNKTDAYSDYFEKYRPDTVFAPDVFGVGDVLLFKSAAAHKVRTVGMVASWDNNTAKGLMRVIPDKLIVQNEIIKDESMNIQDVPEEIIKVVGIAHYDYYKTYKPISRKEYFRKLGLDPKKRLIMFSPAGDKFIATDWQICEILKKAYEKSEIPEDVITVVRVHPTNTVSFKDFIPDEHFIIEQPGVKFEGLGDKRKELDKEGMYHLLDSLAHTELVINVLSSIVIDAAVFDVPVVTIGFEGWEKKVPFGNSVKRYHSDENMAKLLAIGGAPIVRNERELIKEINTYLKHPQKDRDGRAKIVERQCWKLDGRAKFRIAEMVTNNG